MIFIDKAIHKFANLLLGKLVKVLYYPLYSALNLKTRDLVLQTESYHVAG